MTFRELFRKKTLIKPTSKAQGLVEFALVLPVLLLVIVGIIEFGRLIFMYSAVAAASREGARYGAAADNDGGTYRYADCDSIVDTITRIGALVGISSSNITIEYVDGPDTDTIPTGASTCASLDQDSIGRGDRIVVTVQTNFQPIVPLVNFPAIPISSTISRTILKDIQVEKGGSGGGWNTDRIFCPA